MTKKYPKTIHLEEHPATWGCYYTIPGESPDSEGRPKLHHDFNELPPECSLWLCCASGAAVDQLLEAGIGKIVATRPGAYGGEKKTIEIDVDQLEKTCKIYWDNVNKAGEAADRQKNHCHYCGGTPVVSTDFFGAPCCAQCY